MRSQVLDNLPVEPARERQPPPPCPQHRWTEYGEDEIATCNSYGEERGQLRAVCAALRKGERWLRNNGC